MKTEDHLGRTIEELGRELADCWWDQRTGGDDPRTWELTNLDCEWLRDETECSDEEWESVLEAAERGFRARCRELAESALKTATREVGGVTLTLVEGVRYRASRPLYERGRRVYPVKITPLDGPIGVRTQTIHGLRYEAANLFLEAFNNGPTSFDGRVW